MTRTTVLLLLVLAAGCPGESNRSPADGATDLVPVDQAVHEGGVVPDAPVSDGDLGSLPDSAPKPDMLQSSCGPASCPGCCTAAGLCVAGGADIQCGNGGAPCVDCAYQGSTCQGQTCTDCTPDCSGKICGDPDGCGGLCQSGSGCCQPDCSSSYCGEGDGCGGTCKSGSGCTAPDCVYTADSDTLALYEFSGSGTKVTDVTGNHHGTLVGSGGTRVSGKSGCGDAMSFTSTSPATYIEIPDANAFDLTKGSVDLWVRFDVASGTTEGLISRDANGVTYPGHFTIMRRCNGAVQVRLQRPSGEASICSKPLAKDTWYHVGVNFGGSNGLKLYIDGTAVNEPDITCGTSTIKCGVDTTEGIDGNDNPWVVGASSWGSQDGQATPVSNPLQGDIDSVRISKARRSF